MSGSHRHEWLIGQDNSLLLVDATNPDSNSLYTSGTVTWSFVRDSDSVELATGTLTYDNVPGRFRGVLDKTFTDGLTEGAFYTMTYNMNQSGKEGQWVSRKQAQYRELK